MAWKIIRIAPGEWDRVWVPDAAAPTPTPTPTPAAAPAAPTPTPTATPTPSAAAAPADPRQYAIGYIDPSKLPAGFFQNWSDPESGVTNPDKPYALASGTQLGLDNNYKYAVYKDGRVEYAYQGNDTTYDPNSGSYTDPKTGQAVWGNPPTPTKTTSELVAEGWNPANAQKDAHGVPQPGNVGNLAYSPWKSDPSPSNNLLDTLAPSVAFGAITAGVGGVGALGAGLTGTSAAVTAGAVGGGMTAGANDQNILVGAVTGGILAGVTAFLGDIFSTPTTPTSTGGGITDLATSSAGDMFGDAASWEKGVDALDTGTKAAATASLAEQVGGVPKSPKDFLLAEGPSATTTDVTPGLLNSEVSPTTQATGAFDQYGSRAGTVGDSTIFDSAPATPPTGSGVLDWAHENQTLAAAGVITAGGALKGIGDRATALEVQDKKAQSEKDLLEAKRQEEVKLAEDKRALTQSGSYFDAQMRLKRKPGAAVLRRPDGTPVYSGPLLYSPTRGG